MVWKPDTVRHQGSSPPGGFGSGEKPGEGKKIENSSPSKPKPSWYPLAVSSVVILLDTAGYGVIVPLLPDFVGKMALSSLQVSSLFSVYGLVSLLFPVPMGMLADRVDRKIFLLVGLLFKSVALLGYTWANDYAALILIRVLDAIAGAATWTVGLALIADIYPQEELGPRFGIAIAASEIGALGGPLFSGPLADRVGAIWPPFYLMAALCLASVGLVLFLPKRAATSSSRSPLWEIASLISNQSVLLVGALFLFGAAVFGMLEALFPMYLNKSLLFSRSQISFAFGTVTGTFVVLIPLLGIMVSKAKPRVFICSGLAISAFTLPGLVWFRDMVPLFACLVLQGLAWALYFAPAFPLFTDTIRNAGSRHGVAFGLSNAFWAAGFMVGPVIGAGLMQRFGIRAPFLAFGGLMLLLNLVFLGNALKQRHV